MNLKTIAVAAILGLSVPTIADVAISNHAVAAAKFTYPTASFSDGEWNIDLSYRNNAYCYTGTHLPNGSKITLVGATASGTHERQIYTWRNNKLKYQVVWRPSDPNFLRVQVIQGNGKVILNRLLSSAG
ncbi:hypothetical protein NIES4074_45950 [Cylindrospermum sp. NIES-4074]|nr:hypothetical protein NIES4074_45950 [Cylindrospermum sp. NIES-4074]